MEITALFVIAYLATGIAIIGYDFAAPPTQKKVYSGRKIKRHIDHVVLLAGGCLYG